MKNSSKESKSIQKTKENTEHPENQGNLEPPRENLENPPEKNLGPRDSEPHGTPKGFILNLFVKLY